MIKHTLYRERFSLNEDRRGRVAKYSARMNISGKGEEYVDELKSILPDYIMGGKEYTSTSNFINTAGKTYTYSCLYSSCYTNRIEAEKEVKRLNRILCERELEEYL